MTPDTCDVLNIPTHWRRGRRVHADDGSPCYATDPHIVQIIPAPPGLLARYSVLDEPSGVFLNPVLCLALVEDCSGHRRVEGVDGEADSGMTALCADSKNFAGYQFADAAQVEPT